MMDLLMRGAVAVVVGIVAIVVTERLGQARKNAAARKADAPVVVAVAPVAPESSSPAREPVNRI
jgi:hypothetical protein